MFVTLILKKFPDMCLYEEDRIKQLEDTNEFQELLKKSKQRKISAQQGVETKKNNAVEYLNDAGK